MDLSVIIPTLNAAATLPATLAAIRQEMESGTEVIVVDGGSTDGTTRLASGARILNAPQGRGHQLAAGIEAASHDWLLLLHADTRLSPGWHTVAAAHVATTPSPPAASTPSRPITATPSWPIATTPSRPIAATPSWPVAATPSWPVAATPSWPGSTGPSPGPEARDGPDKPGHDGNRGAPPAEQTAGYFRFCLDSDDPRARRLERRVAWRCRVLALPYGDQGLLIHRHLLAHVGGMRPLPLMEDVDLVRRLGRRHLVPLAAEAVTSAAKWERDGWTRRSLRNLCCLSLWFLGVPPSVIRRLYG